jgi:hypothetical protein
LFSRFCREAAVLQPNHELVSLSLAGAYLRNGRNEDAYKSFLLVRRLYPGNWEAPLGMAVLHAAADQKGQVKPLLGDALRLGGQAAWARTAGYPILRELLSGSGSE